MSDLTYAQLATATDRLAKDILRSAETIRIHAQHIDDEAKDTARIAEAIGALHVDSATVAETREAARIMAGLSEDSLAYAAAADTTARAALTTHAQNKDSHSGIGEAAARSTVGHGIYDVDRSWFTQE